MASSEIIRGDDPPAANMLAQANDELAHTARVATLGELMASITHEINQPLAAVVTDGNAALRWLNRAQPDIGEASAAIRRMIAEGLRASEIVARTRKLASKGSGERAAFDANAMVEEAVAITRWKLSGLAAQVELDLSSGLPPAVADRVQLQQVMINLLVNAAQAMADAGSPERRIAVRTSCDGERIVFDVADSGPGVGADDAAQLFNAFFTTRADGMGMGLSVAKTIVEAHGGHIELVTANGSGAHFRFDIPLIAKDGAESRPD